MQAIQMNENGGAEVLKLVEMPIPTPGPGCVLVKNAVAGVNFIDIYHRTGLYPAPLPSVLGVEGAGIVQSVGEGVHQLEKGNRVAYINFSRGSYAQYVVVPAAKTVQVPEPVSLEIATAAMIQGMTAMSLVTQAHKVVPEDVVLVHAAAGGTGQLLAQIAKAKGATVIGTTSSPAKAEVAKRAGCDHVILYTQADVAAEVRRITSGHGVAAVFDGVGKDTFDSSLDSLARSGTLVSFGSASGKVPPLDLLRLVKGNVKVMRPSVMGYIETAEEFQQLAMEVLNMVAEGKLAIEISRVYPLAEAAQAHADLEGRKTTGKLLLHL